jgi:hypothetical protein
MILVRFLFGYRGECACGILQGEISMMSIVNGRDQKVERIGFSTARHTHRSQPAAATV